MLLDIMGSVLDLTARSEHGKMPLQFACTEGNDEIVKLFFNIDIALKNKLTRLVVLEGKHSIKFVVRGTKGS